MPQWRDVRASFAGSGQAEALAEKTRLANLAAITKGVDQFGQSYVDPAKVQLADIAQQEKLAIDQERLGLAKDRLGLLQQAEGRKKSEYEAGLAADALRGGLTVDSYGVEQVPGQAIPLTDAQQIARAKEIELAANRIDAGLTPEPSYEAGDIAGGGAPLLTGKETGAGDTLTRLRDIPEQVKKEIGGVFNFRFGGNKQEVKSASTDLDRAFADKLNAQIPGIDAKYKNFSKPTTKQGNLKSEAVYAKELRKKAKALGKGKTTAEKRGIDLLLKERLAAHGSLLAAQAKRGTDREALKLFGAKEEIKGRTKAKYAADKGPTKLDADYAKAVALKKRIDDDPFADDDTDAYKKAEDTISAYKNLNK